jgi:hypothetical protein
MRRLCGIIIQDRFIAEAAWRLSSGPLCRLARLSEKEHTDDERKAIEIPPWERSACWIYHRFGGRHPHLTELQARFAGTTLVDHLVRGQLTLRRRSRLRGRFSSKLDTYSLDLRR